MVQEAEGVSAFPSQCPVGSCSNPPSYNCIINSKVINIKNIFNIIIYLIRVHCLVLLLQRTKRQDLVFSSVVESTENKTVMNS